MQDTTSTLSTITDRDHILTVATTYAARIAHRDEVITLGMTELVAVTTEAMVRAGADLLALIQSVAPGQAADVFAEISAMLPEMVATVDTDAVL